MNTYGLLSRSDSNQSQMIRVDRRSHLQTESAKFDAVIEDIVGRHKLGQPVLVGTESVEKSEVLSRKLDQHGAS